MKRRQFFRFAVITGFFGMLVQAIQGLFRPAQAATWQKVSSGAPVTSVNGLTGAVTLNNTHVGAPTTGGSGATGTWGISISGNANTATSATTATTATTANGLATGNNYQVNSLGVGTAASGTAGEIRSINNITAYYSDYRLKENIRPIGEPLAKIQQISGCYYNSNARAASFGYTDKSLQVGVIAQEIQKILPEAVKLAPFDTTVGTNGELRSTSGETYLTVQYERIIPLLIESVKELKARVEELERQ